MKPLTGVRIFTREEATKAAGEDPDYISRALFDAIVKGAFPQWDVFAQIMPPQEAETYKVNNFDPRRSSPRLTSPSSRLGGLR